MTTAQPLDVQPTPLALLLLGREAELIVEEANAEARSILRGASAERERLLAEANRVRALMRAALGALDEGAHGAGESPAHAA